MAIGKKCCYFHNKFLESQVIHDHQFRYGVEDVAYSRPEI